MKPKSVIILIAIFAIIIIACIVFKLSYIASNPDIPDWVKFLILTGR